MSMGAWMGCSPAWAGQVVYVKQPDGTILKQEVLPNIDVQSRIDALKNTLDQLQRDKIIEDARRDVEILGYQKELDDLNTVQASVPKP